MVGVQKSINISGDPELCFFEQNPTTKYINFAKDLIFERGKDVASRIMWGIFLAEDPASTVYNSNENANVLRNIVSENYLNVHDVEVDWEGEWMDNNIKMFVGNFMPPAKRRFKLLNDEFDNLLILIREEVDTKKKISLLTSVQSIYKGLNIAEAAYKAEAAELATAQGEVQSGMFGRERD